MKRKALLIAVFLSIILCSLMLSTPQIKVAKADPIVTGTFDASPVINIQSPLNDETYFSNNVILNFSLASSENWTYVNEVLSATIILDNETLPTSYTVPVYNDLWSTYTHSMSLPALKDGTHTLELLLLCKGATGTLFGFAWASVRYFNYSSLSNTVSFNMDANPPKVAALPIENQTAPPVKNESYSMATVALNFTLNKPVSKITYSLDGQDNVTIAGNTTLTNLPYGEHNVTVYATDLYGRIGASNTTVFTISQPAIAKPFPTVLIATVAASTIAASAGVLIYFKKRTNRNLTKKPV